MTIWNCSIWYCVGISYACNSSLKYGNVCRKFEDIFDVDHFIDYLKDDVRIVRDIPEWFTDKTELFSSIRLSSLSLSLYLSLSPSNLGKTFGLLMQLAMICGIFFFRRTVKNIPKYAPAQFYIDNVLPRIKEKKIMALKPFVDRLG